MRGRTGLHVDIMDGHFVPNLTMGPDILRAVREAVPQAYLNVHLMVMRPDLYAPRFIEAGADTVLIHVESPCDVTRDAGGDPGCGQAGGADALPRDAGVGLGGDTRGCWTRC